MRALIADSCPLISQGLKDILSCLGDIESVHEATSQTQALLLGAEVRSQIILVDPDLSDSLSPEGNEGAKIVFLHALKNLPGPPCVISYSASNAVVDLTSAMLAGADGFVHKSTPQDQLAAYIESALMGKPPWRLGTGPKEAQRRLLLASKVERLSNRERDVLTLILQNSTDEQIALRLHITRNTFKKHVTGIITKLGYLDRKCSWTGCHGGRKGFGDGKNKRDE